MEELVQPVVESSLVVETPSEQQVGDIKIQASAILSAEQIDAIDNDLSVEQIEAIGGENLVCETMTTSKITVIGYGLGVEEIKLIGPRNLVEMEMADLNRIIPKNGKNLDLNLVYEILGDKSTDALRAILGK